MRGAALMDTLRGRYLGLSLYWLLYNKIAERYFKPSKEWGYRPSGRLYDRLHVRMRASYQLRQR